MAKLPATNSPFYAACAAGRAKFTVGAHLAGAINVAVQLQDDEGVAVAQRVGVQCWLSDSVAGDGLTGTAPDSSVAIGTNGNILVADVAKEMFTVVSNASGQFDLLITAANGRGPYYLAMLMPDGHVVVSPAIQF